METDDRTTGTLALAAGIVPLASLASLAVFFIVGGLFGPLNDLGNGLTGVLAGALAWRLGGGAGGRAGVWLAVAGAIVMVIGSALVLTRATGFFYAGLVSSIGVALIGAWLVALNRGAAAERPWPPRLATIGTIAGALMLVGIATAPGIAMGLDDMAAAPWWVWLGFVGWLGGFVVYPIWAISLGRSLQQT